MSIKVMSQVWEHSQHKGSNLLLLLAIADHADDNGQAFPGVNKLAKKTRMGKRNTQYNLDKLVASGELAIYKNKGIETPKGRTNLYKINVNLWGANFAPLDADGVQNPTNGVQPIAPKPSVKTISKEIYNSFTLLFLNLPQQKTILQKFANNFKLVKSSANELIISTTPQHFEILTARYNSHIKAISKQLGVKVLITVA